MKVKGYIFAVLSAAMYGSIGLFVKNGISEDFSPFDLIMLQMMISIGLVGVVCLVKFRGEFKLSKDRLIKLLILGGGANTGILVFNYQSYKYLSIPVATVILYTYPALVAIATAVILKAKVSKYKVVAIIGTFIGCLLVINIFSPAVLQSIQPVGVLYAFLAAVAFAFFNMYATKILDDIHPIIVTLFNAIFTLGMMTLINFGFYSKIGHITWPLLVNTFNLAVFCGIIPSLFFYYALKYVGSIPVSIIGTLEIPLAAFMAFAILGESITAVQIVGVVVSLLSVLLLRLEK